MSIQNDQTTDKQGSGLGIIMRLFWMFFGNAILFISIIFVFQHKGGVFHTADVVFWVTVAVLAFVRYLDIKFCSGFTVMGLPASMAHWIKYVAILLISSTAVWVLAHAVNYLVVN
ncbi:MAG: hypothetical protein NTX52_11320, partial [Planctomycetota bacterium]|nr:hypothetical protein [Planctomycetota bacterium]